MILYHSSNIIVPKPDILHSRDGLDFGKGFYLTSIYSQAVSYALRFQRRGQPGWLNSYEFNYNPDEWDILRFDSYDDKWLNFISTCRVGKDPYLYDMVIGGVADDKVIRTLDRFFEKEITSDQALGLLKYEKPNIQYCIRSQVMLESCLHYIDSHKL